MQIKAQASMLLIAIVVIIFVGLAIFLLSFAKTLSQTDYMNLYVHNAWLSVSRADTGYSGSDCKLVSDVVGCAFLKPYWRCDGLSCFELANLSLTNYLNAIQQSKKGMRYFLRIEPFQYEGGELRPVVMKLPSGKPLRYEIGDRSLEAARVQKWVANEIIPKGQYILKVKLIMAQK